MGEPKTVLVLGGGGFIGRHTVEHLRAASREVRVLDLYKPEDVHVDIDWRIGGSFDREALRLALDGVAAVVDLSASGRPGMTISSLSSDIAHNLAATLETVEICRDAGARRYVFPSSGGTVYGLSAAASLTEDAHCLPINAYGAGKLAAEHYLRLLKTPDFRAVVLRVANPFGEGQRPAHGQGFIGAVFDAAHRKAALEIWGNGHTIRDFIYVGDVAEAFDKALDYAGAENLFNVGSGVGRDLNTVMRAIRDETGVDVEKAYLPERRIDIGSNVLDISLAGRELGWTPRTDFRDALRRTAQWWAQKR